MPQFPVVLDQSNDGMDKAFAIKDYSSSESEDASGKSTPTLFPLSDGINIPSHFSSEDDGNKCVADDDDERKMEFIRRNLPKSAVISTPFGNKRVVYADYTASGRSLTCIEKYVSNVVLPMFANTHTESSATGLQTNAFREEARRIVMESLHAPQDEYTLIFTGSGTTAAIAKLIGILGIKLPPQLLEYCGGIPVAKRPLVLITAQEHHSNELLWRETNTCDVRVVPSIPSVGTMDLKALVQFLKHAKQVEQRKLIIGSFNAGSNVTGICNDTAKITQIMHKFGAYACFDFAGAAPYVNIDIQAHGMDAVFLSPHKFVGGPGTPGVLCLRKDFYRVNGADKFAPSVPGGGTVTLVWGGLDGISAGVMYDNSQHTREESGTPAIIETIRCGLVFHIRNQIGIRIIEEREAAFAQRAVERFQRHGNIIVMGEQYSELKSPRRLSITSFNLKCKPNNGQAIFSSTGTELRLNHHFVSALLNDLYGIQSRSGCSCAAPYGLRMFEIPEARIMEFKTLIASGNAGANLGWARINFNYFITEEEFNFLCTAVEQIATHGWKLLPMYSICMKTGLWSFSSTSFNRYAKLRSLTELFLMSDDVCTVTEGNQSFESILNNAMDVYNNASAWVRENLPHCRDYTDKTMGFTAETEHLRFYALASDVLPYLCCEIEEL